MDHISPAALDFANHHANATREDIRILCKSVLAHGFNSAFVNPVHVAYAHSLMEGKGKVGTVVSFPLGQDVREVKILALQTAIGDGADELDIVPDSSLIMTDRYDEFEAELRALVNAARTVRESIIVKFIIETGLFVPEHFLTLNTPEITKGREQIVNASKCIERSGADFVKICSGMAKRGVSVDDVTLIRSIVSPKMKVKGAGGVDTKEEALAILAAGANRIGTSHAPKLVEA